MKAIRPELSDGFYEMIEMEAFKNHKERADFLLKRLAEAKAKDPGNRTMSREMAKACKDLVNYRKELVKIEQKISYANIAKAAGKGKDAIVGIARSKNWVSLK